VQADCSLRGLGCVAARWRGSRHGAPLGFNATFGSRSPHQNHPVARSSLSRPLACPRSMEKSSSSLTSPAACSALLIGRGGQRCFSATAVGMEVTQTAGRQCALILPPVRPHCLLPAGGARTWERIETRGLIVRWRTTG
jgi:hypothetical protein